MILHNLFQIELIITEGITMKMSQKDQGLISKILTKINKVLMTIQANYQVIFK